MRSAPYDPQRERVRVTHSAAAVDEIRQAFATGAILDLAGADVPATLLVAQLAGTALQADGLIPALRLAGATVRGPLELPGATVPVLVEFTSCTFDEPIDLYAANLAGWRLARCTLRGLQAANVRVRSELTLENCTVTGPVVLPDARVEGLLRLIGTRLDTPGGHALVGVRLVVSGVLDARGLQANGEVQLSGARVDGNIDLRGARLARPGGDALEASGVQVGGNLRCDRGFSAQGRVVLAGASVAGNAVFSGAALQGSTNPDEPAVLVLPRGSADPTAALVADRLAVNGNLLLDAGLAAAGSVRVTNARVGAICDFPARRWAAQSSLSAAGARPGPIGRRAGARQREPDRCPAARSGTGRARRRPVAGRWDAVPALGGGLGVDPAAPRPHRLDPGLHRRPARRATVPAGRVDQAVARRQGRHDRQRRLHQPRVHRYRGRTAEPRRGVEVGGLHRRPARRAGKGVSALHARGMTCQELRLRFAGPPRGDVSLACVTAGSVFDDEQLWTTEGKVDIEEFRYQSLTARPEADVATRLRWLRAVLPGYDPDPYDHLATSYRHAGHDDRADTVLLAKQRHRHTAPGPAGRVWGWLQEGPSATATVPGGRRGGSRHAGCSGHCGSPITSCPRSTAARTRHGNR